MSRTTQERADQNARECVRLFAEAKAYKRQRDELLAVMMRVAQETWDDSAEKDLREAIDRARP